MSPLCFPFIIVPLILIRVPASLGADIAQFTNCSTTIQCGTLENISYPFWGVNRADYCGLSSEFQLTCVDNTSLQISISGLSYRVLRVDNSSRLFTVARADYYNNSICPQYLYNASQDISPFTYSSDTVTSNLTLYYGCGAPSAAISPVLTTSQFTCTVNNTAPTFGYFLTRSAADITVTGISSSITTIANITNYFGECDTSVVVPANQSALQTIEDSPSEATVVAALDGGFGLQWADDGGACQSCITSGGQCGRNLQDSSKFACYCSDKSYSSTCGGGENRIPVFAIIGVVAGLIGIIAVLILVIICRHKSWRSLLKTMICSHENGDNHADIETFITAHGSLAPKRYRYWDVKKMTNSFSEKLGTGGYGVVYKGKLGDGHHVAVKVLTESKGNVEDFLNEVASISRTAHVNVITLLGFCYERKRRALIYEYMPNGSLDKFMQTKEASDTSSPFLELKILYQIALGIARGLEYLHQGCNTRILHFDIKPQNILLDENFIPKISDFGLAKLCKKRESIVSMLGVRGTVGYIAPEVFSRSFGGVSHKSDVYSYGMLVLDMVGGRNKSGVQVSHTSESYFPDLIYRHLEEGGDIQLPGTEMEEEEETVRKMVLVGLWCIQTHPSNRPSMKKVIEMLEGSIQVLQIPPKPRLSSPRRSPKNSSFTSFDFTSSILNEEMNPELQEKRGQRNSGQL